MRVYNIPEFIELVNSGMSYDEIGVEYGITRNGVRQRVYKMKKLGYLPEDFDGRKNSRKQIVISSKENTGVKKPRKVCVNNSCNECIVKCDAFKLIEALVHNGIELKVDNKVYIALRKE
ncbi:MAG: hypothetical protein IKL07_05140 [Clostridium sp.]|nr:hypothetical protein [Clostridium sp.]